MQKIKSQEERRMKKKTKITFNKKMKMKIQTKRIVKKKSNYDQ